MPILKRELAQCGVEFSPVDVIDVVGIYHKLNPRTLESAYKSYVDPDGTVSHDALSDAMATLRVLSAMCAKHGLDADVDSLASLSKPERLKNAVDSSGKLIKKDGDIYINFGKYRGRKLADIVLVDRGYVEWMTTMDSVDITFLKTVDEFLA